MTPRSEDYLRWLVSSPASEETTLFDISQRSAIPMDGVDGWVEWHVFREGMQTFLFSADFHKDAGIRAGDTVFGPALTAFLPLSGESEVTPAGGRSTMRCSPSGLYLLKVADRHADHFYRAGARARVVALSLPLEGMEIFFDGPIPDIVRDYACPSPPEIQVRAVDPRLRMVATQMMDADLRGPIRALYLEGKSLEIAALILNGLTGEAAPGPVDQLDRRQREGVLAAREMLLSDLATPPSLADLAETAGMSPRTFGRAFTRVYGMPVFEYLREQRLLLAREALLEAPVPLKVLAHRLGYAHINSFVHAFRQRFGMSPARFSRCGGVDGEE